MLGYHGKFLMADLSTQQIQDMHVPEIYYKQFIGGCTLAAKLLFKHVKRGMDPLNPESPLIFSTGPFTGTSIPMVSRYCVSGISPLTGYWGEATSGGVFPFRLKGTGYDGLFIIGKSDQPVYLEIDESSAHIKNATELWGKNSYATQKIIKKERKGLSVACIGKAGEKLINFAGIMNDEGRAAGRCGLGAVMGSKNLKAVVVSGNLKPKIADTESLKNLTKEFVGTVNASLLTKAFREYGTLMWMDMGMIMSDVPTKYYQKSVFPAEKVSGLALRQNYVVENYACLGCPIGCGRTIRNFKEGVDVVDGPEYETAGAFGPLCMNFDYDSIILANHLCNDYGLDTISTGVSIAYAMYLFDLGVLSKEQIGMELKWGDGQAILKLIKLIIKQEGIGKVISQGTRKMAQEFGRDESEAANVKGLEMPLHDARAFHGMAISYATGPRGACHLKGDYYNVDLASPVLEFGILPGDRLTSLGKAEMAAKYQNFKDLFDALTLCKFSPLNPTQICQGLNAITGWEINPEGLLELGERSINIKRSISNKLGLAKAEDRLPNVCLKPLEEGSTVGIIPDMDLLLKDYYNYRQWDWETGKPSKARLVELGLQEIADDLYN